MSWTLDPWPGELPGLGLWGLDPVGTASGGHWRVRVTGSWPCFSSCNAAGGGGAASHLRGELPADGDTGGLPSSREQRVSSPSSSRSQGMVSLGRGACCCTSAGQRNRRLGPGARPGRDGGSSPGCRVARIPGRVLPCGWTPGPLSPWHREAFQTQPGGVDPKGERKSTVQPSVIMLVPGCQGSFPGISSVLRGDSHPFSSSGY